MSLDALVHNPTAPVNPSPGTSPSSEGTNLPDGARRTSDAYDDFVEQDSWTTGQLQTILTTAKRRYARGYRAIEAGSVTVITGAGNTRTRSYLAGEGYDVLITDVVAAGKVLVFL